MSLCYIIKLNFLFCQEQFYESAEKISSPIHKIFFGNNLSVALRLQIQCLSLKGENLYL